MLHGHTAAVFRLAFSPDGRPACVGFAGQRRPSSGVRAWAEPGQGSPRVLIDHTSYVYPVTFSPDGRTIASGAWDREIRLRDAATGETRAVLRGNEHYVADLAFSPDNRWLVSRSGDQTIRVWEVATGKPRGPATPSGGLCGRPARRRGHAGRDPRRSRPGTSSTSGLPEGREAGTWLVPTDSARAVEYSPDGHRLAVVDNGRDVPILDTRAGETRVRLRGQVAG